MPSISVRDMGGYHQSFERFAAKRKSDDKKRKDKHNKPQRGKAGRDFDKEEGR